MKRGEVGKEEQVVEVGFLGAFSVWESNDTQWNNGWVGVCRQALVEQLLYVYYLLSYFLRTCPCRLSLRRLSYLFLLYNPPKNWR